MLAVLFSVLAVCQAIVFTWALPGAFAPAAWLASALTLLEYLCVRGVRCGHLLSSLQAERASLVNERLGLMVEFEQLDPLGKLKREHASPSSHDDDLVHQGHVFGGLVEEGFGLENAGWYGVGVALGIKAIGAVAKGSVHAVKVASVSAKHWLKTSSTERDTIRERRLQLETRAKELHTKVKELDLQIRGERLAVWGGGFAVVTSYLATCGLCLLIRATAGGS